MSASIILLSISIFIVFASFVIHPFRSGTADMDKTIDGWVSEMLANEKDVEPQQKEQKRKKQDRREKFDKTGGSKRTPK